MKKPDIVAGIIGILLSGYVLWATTRFPEDRVLLLGPAFFPRLLAYSLLVFSVGLIILALLGKSMKTNEKFSLKDPAVQRAGASLLATIVYCLLFPYLGFILCSIIYLMFLMFLLKLRNYFKMILISTAISLVIYGIFSKALNITLPNGFLG
ncbi:MAG: tripartite tricarboxylate transporter TctB family protein [Bacillota bacterium]